MVSDGLDDGIFIGCVTVKQDGLSCKHETSMTANDWK
jgi:hypothetical protein